MLYLVRSQAERANYPPVNKINYKTCILKDGEILARKIKLKDNRIETFIIKEETNPCRCGCNCFHSEDDGEKIYGVCNSCNKDVYIFKERQEFEEWKYLK